ncbi:MAG TPA: class II fumarate hydratase [Balneolales bacterium]|nr:class II fumarate hydratase [Balneolales bacterium]
MSDFRIEKDSMGEIKVPADAYYGAQTQRAVNNFPISGITFPRHFIQALGYIKITAATVNRDLGKLDADIAKYIIAASEEVVEGKYDKDFPIDIYQTGSGTSTNMNANEVISKRANELASKDGNNDLKIHPNDHVNFGQSSNDVIPTTIRISAYLLAKNELIPSLTHLKETFLKRGEDLKDIVKTGRTHLMDAMPVTFGQVFSGYARQMELGVERVQSAMERLSELPQGGTAVGTGLNTHPDFGKKFAEKIGELTGGSFSETSNHFESQGSVDTLVELSGQLKTIAVSLMKIANDLRWMNSGPNSGLSEITLPALQPGSSIMPGKINPVIEESVTMVCAQVIGNDAAVTVGGQAGNFELNVMLPVVALNLLQSLKLLANVSRNLADKSIANLSVNTEKIKEKLKKNPILVTALNPIIGYETGAKIAKKAFAENRALKEVAKEMTDLSDKELDEALDPIKMTKGGFTE